MRGWGSRCERWGSRCERVGGSYSERVDRAVIGGFGVLISSC